MPGASKFTSGALPPSLDWADLREDKMILPAGFLADFRPLWGPRRTPGAFGRAPARKIVQVAPEISSGEHF